MNLCFEILRKQDKTNQECHYVHDIAYYVFIQGVEWFQVRIPLRTALVLILEAFSHLLQVQTTPPPMGFSNEPEIKFEVDCTRMLPTASTCGPTLYLPITLTDPDTFKNKMDVALICAHGFGSV